MKSMYPHVEERLVIDTLSTMQTWIYCIMSKRKERWNEATSKRWEMHELENEFIKGLKI